MSLILENIRLPLPEFELSASATLEAPITGLIGPSGSGKTTLLEIIAGLRRPVSGRVMLDGQPLTDCAGRRHVPPEKRRVGYVPQDLALFPHLDAGENLHFGFRGPRRDPHLPARVIEVLEIGGLLSRSISQLSGGEKQRVALGRAVLTCPRLLLLDEPLSSLDEPLKARILPYIRSLHDAFRIPILFVTHSPTELSALCDDIRTIDRGVLG